MARVRARRAGPAGGQAGGQAGGHASRRACCAGDLPPEVLVRILRRCDQTARVLARQTCRAVKEAAEDRCLWRSMTIVTFDDSGVQFAGLAAPEELVLRPRSPDDAAAFLDDLADREPEAAAGVTRLRVAVGSVERVPNALLATACRLRNLEALEVTAQEVRRETHLSFPARVSDMLPRLRSLRVAELNPEPKHLTLHFRESPTRPPCLAALETLSLDVASCNLLAFGASALPSAKVVSYHNDDDMYDDLDLAGMDLDVLELTLGFDAHVPHVYDQLSLMRRVGTLRLLSWDDLHVDTPIPAECLELCLLVPETCVQLDLLALRAECPALRRVSIGRAPDESDPPQCKWTARFINIMSLAEWVAFSRSVVVDVDTTCFAVRLERLFNA